MAKKNYVESSDIESCWTDWLSNGNNESWDKLQGYVYIMCQGIATKFNPKSEEEHSELTHETFILTIEKIKNKRLVFTPGRAPVFNLLTTTIYRHLFSFMNKKNRRRKSLLTKYALRSNQVDASDLNGNNIRHPDSGRLISGILNQIAEDEIRDNEEKLFKELMSSQKA